MWSPDGSKIAFASDRYGNFDIFVMPADGGTATRLTYHSAGDTPTSFTPDGEYLIYREEGSQTQWDLYTIRVEDRQIEVFLKTDFHETNAEFSPDGRWVAYDSNESGRRETYVRPFPASTGKWQISTDGGGNPTWSRPPSVMDHAGVAGSSIT